MKWAGRLKVAACYSVIMSVSREAGGESVVDSAVQKEGNGNVLSLRSEGYPEGCLHPKSVSSSKDRGR
jgi:hypothetical protein